MNWLVGGYYGLGNIGDELMCRCVVDWILENDPNGSVGVIMAKGGDSSQLWLPETVQVHALPTGGLLEYYKLFTSIDYYIVGGGTCFHRFGVCGFYQNVAAQLNNAKIIWIGIGADELGSLKNHLRGWLVLTCVDAISTRDTESANQIERLYIGQKVKIAPDLVFAASNLSSWPQASFHIDASTSLVVTWRDLSPYLNQADNQKLTSIAATLLVELAHKKGLNQIAVINMADSIDGASCSNLHATLKATKNCPALLLINKTQIENKLTWIRTAGAVISARLHPLMLSTFAKRPTFGLAYAEKISRFATLFEDSIAASLDDWLQNPKKVRQQALNALSSPPRFRRSLEELRSETRHHKKLLITATASNHQRPSRSAI